MRTAPRRTRTSVVWALGLVAALSTTRGALADDKAECLGASMDGQKLRDAHKLVEAADRFRACALQKCPTVVQVDCENWFDEVEKLLPTVVLEAKDERGQDIFDVRVAVDGKPLAAKLDGVALPLDPGPHDFRFERADGSSVDQHVLVREGLKAQSVTVSFSPPASAPVPSAALASQLASPQVPSSDAPPAPRGSDIWRTTGWTIGAAGLAALGVGGAFGIIAASKKGDAQCGSDGVCANYGAVQDAKSAATAANVAFVIGGVLAAGGAGLLLFGPRPHSNRPTTARVDLAPALGPRDAGLAVRGLW